MVEAQRTAIMAKAAATIQAIIENDLECALDEIKRRTMTLVAQAYDKGFNDGQRASNPESRALQLKPTKLQVVHD